MGRPVLIWRLVRGDVARRRIQSLLLIAMIAATTATLTLALALNGVTRSPFARTHAATKGPDVAGLLYPPGFHGNLGTLKQFAALRHAPGVTSASGPYPIATFWLTAHGHRVRVHAEGRDEAQAPVDRPLLTAGHWLTPGSIVLERGFADALAVQVGDLVDLGGRRLVVRGIALTTAVATSDPLVWLSRATLDVLSSRSQPLWYALNLKLANPGAAAAAAFANAHNTPNAAWSFQSWESIRADDSTTVSSEQQLLGMGSGLLAMIAMAGIAVMVGGRMAEQTRRVGLLKAVGATPRLVAAILMAENVTLSIIGMFAGVALGRLIAPTLTGAGNSLLGSAGSPALSLTMVGLAAALAIAVAAAATLMPALSGARTSTLRALNDPARPPQRQTGLIELSARLPVPLLLAVRLIARRPRRAMLTTASIAIAVATFIATLLMRHTSILGARVAGNLLAATKQDGLDHVGTVLSIILLVIGAVNLLTTAWATVVDAQRPTALARALGATPSQIATGLAGAQLGPALAAAILGYPIGLVLYLAAGGNPAQTSPPILLLLAAIPGTLIAVGMLTAIPARIGAIRPVVEVLRSD
jgi:putative ABC transport system permease protein